MPPAARRPPWFAIRASRSTLLEEQGCSPWVFEAVTLLCLLKGKKRIQHSVPLPFRLDTGAFVSLIPEAWVSRKALARFLGNLSGEVSFSTAAGTGTGHL